LNRDRFQRVALLDRIDDFLPAGDLAEHRVLAVEPGGLVGKHTVFGEVLEGMDVVDTISELPRDARDRPNEDAIIERIEIAD